MSLLLPHGTMGRAGFAVGLAVCFTAFWLGIRGAEAALPSMAEVLAPRGINAGFALNAIWSVLGLALVWSLIVLGARRLRDVGRSPWWAAAAVLPLATLALLNDAIFLVSRTLVLPPLVQWLVAVPAVGIGVWVLAEGLLRPSHAAEARAPSR